MLYAGYPNTDSKQVVLKEPSDLRNVRCIDGTFTSRSKCGGYCANEIHIGYLTSNQTKQHKCHERECKFFYLLKPIEKRTKKKPQDSVPEGLLHHILQLTKSNEGMRVIKIEPEEDAYEVLYVSIAHYDLKHIVTKVEHMTGKIVKMRRLDISFDQSASLIFG